MNTAIQNTSRADRLFKQAITDPGDVLTITHFPGLSSTLSLRHTNENEPGYSHVRAVDNSLRNWKWLKAFNEMGGRKVQVEQEDGSVIPFEQSIGYVHRFVSETEARRMSNAKR